MSVTGGRVFNIARLGSPTQASGGTSARHPLPPHGFVGTNHHQISAADEWKSQHKRLFRESRQPALVRHLRVAESELVESPRILVHQSHDTEFLGEPSQLPDRCGFLHQIYEMRSDAALGEESQRFPRIGAFPDSENLNFQSRISLMNELHARQVPALEQ